LVSGISNAGFHWIRQTQTGNAIAGKQQINNLCYGTTAISIRLNDNFSLSTLVYRQKNLDKLERN